MNIKTGTQIRYSSAAGVLTATVYNIVLGLNAAKQTIPWIDLEINSIDGKEVSAQRGTRLCATDGYLKQMKVEVL